MKKVTLVLAALMVFGAGPASGQKTRVLLRGPSTHGHITSFQADSVARYLRHCLLQTDAVELVSYSDEVAQPHGVANASPQTLEAAPMADEIVEVRLQKSGDTFALTITALETAENVSYTCHGEAKTLAELRAAVIPEFVQQLMQRHGPDRLVIRVERGFDIYPMDKYFGVSDPFVEVYVDTILVGVTEVRQDERDPAWNQAFLLPLGTPREITLVVYDKDALDHRELIGKVTVPWGRDGIYSIRRPHYVGDFGKVQVSFGK